MLTAESTVRQYGADIADLEGIVLLFGFAGLRIELAVHEEIDYGHYEGDAQKHHSECYGTGHVHVAAEFGEEGRENHAGGDTEPGESHLGTHCEGHLAALEPFHDSAAHGNAGHLAAATEDHKADCGELGGSRHPPIERRNAQLVEARDIIEVLGEPGLQAAADERFAHGEPLDAGACEHHSGREYRGEADSHLVENDSGEDQEEHEDVEEHFGSLHRAECGGIPSPGFLHQVLDRGEDVHENV